MQQHKIVEDYLNSVIPEKISTEAKTLLREEIECHIYDKAEFFMEIGYDEEVAFQKAVEGMGEAEPVRQEFNSIYKDSLWKAVLLFTGICAVNILSVSTFGLGYWYFVEPSLHILPSVIWLALFLAGFVFLIVHTVKCHRQRLDKQFVAITSAFALVALGSFITSGIFYPILNAGTLVYRFITNGPEAESEFGIYILNIVIVSAYALITFILCFSSDVKLRKKPYRLSLKSLTAILSTACVCFLILYGFAYDKYEWVTDEFFAEDSQDAYLSFLTAEQKKLYDEIRVGDSAEETDKRLTEKGFEKQSDNYKKFLKDSSFVYEMDTVIKEKCEAIGKNDYSIYRNIQYMYEEDEEDYDYTFYVEGEYDFNDIVSLIIVAYDDSEKISCKLFIPDVNSYFGRSYMNKSHCENSKKWYSELQKGEQTKEALEFIRSTDAFIIEDEKINGKNTVNTYQISFECYYYLKPTFVNFLFDFYPGEIRHKLNLEIEAENGVITDFKEFDWYDDSADFDWEA